jgi:hypothetical protein
MTVGPWSVPWTSYYGTFQKVEIGLDLLCRRDVINVVAKSYEQVKEEWRTAVVHL